MVAGLAKSGVILVSARDPSAALALVPVVRHLAGLSTVTVHVVAQNPAYEIFQKESLNVVQVQSAPLNHRDDGGAAELLAEAREILDKVQPDVLLAGLSSPGIGIDEALLAHAGDIPSYSIQDPPGYIVPGFDSRARTQFVAGIDFLESEETARRPRLSGIAPFTLNSWRNNGVRPWAVTARPQCCLVNPLIRNRGIATVCVLQYLRFAILRTL